MIEILLLRSPHKLKAGYIVLEAPEEKQLEWFVEHKLKAGYVVLEALEEKQLEWIVELHESTEEFKIIYKEENSVLEVPRTGAFDVSKGYKGGD